MAASAIKEADDIISSLQSEISPAYTVNGPTKVCSNSGTAEKKLTALTPLRLFPGSDGGYDGFRRGCLRGGGDRPAGRRDRLQRGASLAAALT